MKYSKEELYELILEESKKLNDNFKDENHKYIANILDDSSKTVEEKIAECAGILNAINMKYTEALLTIILNKVL